MKLLKPLAAATLAVVLAGTASAQTVIHVVGSTAFRAATSIAIVDALSGASPSTTYPGLTAGSGSVYVASDGTNYTTAAHSIYSTTTIPGGVAPSNAVIVECYWTGSLAGVVDLVVQAASTTTAETSDTFLDYTKSGVYGQLNNGLTTSYVPADSTAIPVTGANAGNLTTTTAIDMAMSDSYDKTIAEELSVGTTFLAPVGGYTSGAQLASTISGETLIQNAGTTSYAGNTSRGYVACVPFEWVFNNYSTSAATTLGMVPPSNMTQQLAEQLIGSVGYLPQASFTGTQNTGDLHNWFFLVGRNEDSGTRIGYLDESQLGVTAPVKQWYVSGSNYENGSSSTNTQSGNSLFPIVALNTEPNIEWNTAGHSGYGAGSDITGGVLKVQQTGAATWYSTTVIVHGNPVVTSSEPSDVKNTDGVWYLAGLGLTDAFGTTGAGGTTAVALKYNGVSYSAAAVQSGAYSYWEYEHCYELKSPTNTAATPYINNIADLLYAADCDVVYLPTLTNGYAAGAYHTENSDGTYTTVYGLAPGLKIDSHFTATRTLSEGGPVSVTY